MKKIFLLLSLIVITDSGLLAQPLDWYNGHFETTSFQQGLEAEDDGESVRVSSLRIQTQDRDSAKVKIHIASGAYANCSFEGEMVHKRRHLEYSEVFADGSTCVLKVKPQGQAIVIQDVKGHCRQMFCDATGTFNNEKFEM